VDDAGAAFRTELAALVARVGRAGQWTALSRVAIHLTSPGTPDIYQGDELWFHALVDPDNRRPVDLAARAAALDALEALDAAGGDPAAALLPAAADGRLKLHLVRRLLRARRSDPALWTRGSYVPVAAEGLAARHVVAFARTLEGRAAVTVAPRFPLLLRADGEPPIGEGTWAGTSLVLPPEVAAAGDATVRDLLTGRTVRLAAGRVPLGEVLGALPVALLVAG
jgi:(1->4)-alpha-D-glucan 1-alpha-D-glucosylmutase